MRIVFGIPVPSVDPVFLTVVRFHLVVGIVCVLAGATAMLSRKRRGRHSMFATVYYWCLAIVVATATGCQWCLGQRTIICSLLAAFP
jgi:uncharacterized membrane protein HdeD (DUF308 family)